MKAIALLTILLSLASCTATSPELATKLTEALATAVSAADKNQDGALSNREVTDSKNDPSFWIALGGALLGLFGAAKGQQASKGVDQLYDATHAPIAKG
jgi:hypothetical protein